MNLGTHEDFSRLSQRSTGSDRSFGFVFGIFLAIVAFVPTRSGHLVRKWALLCSVILFLLALIRPQVLRPLNIFWTHLGLAIGKISNPIIMTLIYFVVFTPIAILFRIMKRDPLRLRFDPEAASYWILRNPSTAGPDSMRNQF
jgi:hypothetical protein